LCSTISRSVTPVTASIVGVLLAAGSAAAASAPPPAAVTQETLRAAEHAADQARHHVASDPWFWGNLLAAAVVLLGLWGKDCIRPGSLRRAGSRNVAPHPWIIYLGSALLVFLVPAVSTALLQLPGLDLGPPEGPKYHAAAALAAYPLSIAAAALLARLIALSAPASGLRWHARDLPIGLLLGILVFPVTQAAAFAALALHRALTGAAPDHVAHDTLRMLLDHPRDPWVWTAVGLAVFAAPVLEELLYRGFLQSAFVRAWGRPWTAVLLSAAVFTASHLSVGPWYGLVPIFTLAVGLGVAFERTRSIAVPIGMHVLFNAANVVLAMMMG
jgi:membrane protease YdiL (CAAX protease family)